mgnify:CR=1 FL=1
MTKNEIIEAINATIVTNGQKGITAESLANILREMVYACAGLPHVHIGSVNMKTGELSQTAEQKAHNAEVFQLVKASEEVLPAIILNMSGFYEAMLGAPVQASLVSFDTILTPVGLIPGVEEEVVTLASIEATYILLADGTITVEPQIEE